MPTPKSAARRRLDELLADGTWHDRATIVAAIEPLVPPGKASRHAQAERDRNRWAREKAKGGPLGPPTGGGTPSSDRTGAHDIAMRTLNRAVQTGAIERRTLPDGTVQIRRRPKTGGE